jgi:8-oxo-dGTP pyrophosphatase MutT (NUDIX family)
MPPGPALSPIVWPREPPRNLSEYKSAFVLPYDSDQNRVLMIRETRDKREKLGLFGGKSETADTHSFNTIAREFQEELESACVEQTEETRSEVSDAVTSMRTGNIKNQSTFFERGKAVGYIVQLKKGFESVMRRSFRNSNVEWIDVSKAADFEWRAQNMHFHASVLCCNLIKTGLTK